jgi:hypothetical protein
MSQSITRTDRLKAAHDKLQDSVAESTYWEGNPRATGGVLQAAE